MPMTRSHYRNGDPITLPGGCDGCSPSVINGILCHELGCPDSWRDDQVACHECGCDFYRTEGRHERVCPDCAEIIELAAGWGEIEGGGEDDPS